MEIIWRGSTGYEEARVRRVFNFRRPDRYPLAVVFAKREDDIVETVKLAREHRTRIAIRSGGHSFAVWSVRDDSILLDLTEYHGVEVDVESQIACVSPSTRSDVDIELMHKYGLIFGGGHCPSVGLGGYLLQAGFGWNCKNWGFGCERVKAVDVVTAAGELVHCNEEENSDLFWAARGAGPVFPGIVTRFHLKLRPAPKVFRSSGYIFPKKLYRQAFDWILAISPTFDHDTEIKLLGMYPDGQEEVCFMVGFLAMKNTAEEARDALAPAQETRPDGAIEEWFAHEDSFEQSYAAVDQAFPSGRRWLVDNAFIKNDVDVPAVLEEAFFTIPSREFAMMWFPISPRSRQSLPDMAFSLKSDNYFCVYAAYENEKDDDEWLAWLRQTMRKIEPSSIGTFTGETDFLIRKSKYWGEAEGEKLNEIRKKWDPEGRICGYLDADQP